MRTRCVTVRSRTTAPRAKGLGPMSIARVLGILEAISSGVAPLSLSQLARMLGIPKSSLLALLGELEQQGLVQRNEDGQYLQGGRSRRLGLQLVAPGSLAALVRQTVRAVGKQLGMTATFSRLDAATRSLIYGDRCDVPDPVRFALSLGQPLDLHCRSAGKLLLACLPRQSRLDWLGAEPYRAMTEATHTSWRALEPELDRIALCGVAWSHGESFPGVASCNVGVAGADGRVMAALGIETPIARLQADPPGSVPVAIEQTLRSAAAGLSAAMVARGISADALPQHI